MSQGSWLPPPESGWRPPRLQDQLGLMVGTALLVDVLLMVWLLGRPWGGISAGLRNAVLCGAVPLNLMGLVALSVWLWRRRHGSR